jgi:hypothetical protein
MMNSELDRNRKHALQNPKSTLRFKLVFKARFFFFYLLKEGVLSPHALDLYYQQVCCLSTHSLTRVMLLPPN